MGNDWLRQLRQIIEDDDDIEELEVKVEYEDGRKKKWIFTGDARPVLEDNDDEEDDEDDEDDDEDSDGSDDEDNSEEYEADEEDDSDDEDEEDEDEDEEYGDDEA
ncbi:DNA primase [Brevibacillus invocatus]|uniref:DNA primase n=1 Tax=Brevibacillus invocatus TaxID=173959 RepID=UPI001606993D|nr:DNA primase [Brevibacillus invocatus]